MVQLRKLLHKKQDFGSVIIIVGLAIVAAILMLLFGNMYDGLYTDTLEVDDFNNPNSTAVIQDMHDSNIPIFDNLGFWFLLASLIGLIVSAIYLGYHPVTMILFAIMLFIAVYLAAEGANLRDDFASDTDMAPTAQEMTLSQIAFGRYFPLIIAVIGVVVLIIMFSKKNAGGGF